MRVLPYLPDGKEILYVAHDHEFMQLAGKTAQGESFDLLHPTGAVLVKDDKVIGTGANGSIFHEKWGCLRKLIKAPTGKYYVLCGGCSPKNHAEQQAIKDALKKGNEVKGADLYLWGHWWCCGSCWDAMIKAGIKNVYLMKDAWEQFGEKRV